MAQRIVYKRNDGTWGWRLVGDNDNDTIAVDGGQTYENKADAEDMADKVVSGHYSGAEKIIDD